MDPPSIKNLMGFLCKYSTTIGKSEIVLDEINPENVRDNSWRARTCAILVDYVWKLCYGSDHENLRQILKRLDDLAAFWTFNYSSGTLLSQRQKLAKIFVNSFILEIEKFFTVPKPHKFSVISENPMRIEILACFMDFLVRILISEEGWNSGVARLTPLKKELTFLVTVLGDTPFSQYPQLILDEFEEVANEAGNLIYSRVFAFRIGADFCLGDLLGKIRVLYEKIQKHCLSFSKLSRSVLLSSKAVAVDSVFIVDSVLENLENLMNCKNIVLFGDVKYKITEFYGEFILWRSVLSDENLERNTCLDGINRYMLSIGDALYEADYLINSFVVGNLPFWYFILRLPNIVREIKILREGIEKTKENLDVDVLKVEKHIGSDVLSQFTETRTDIVENVVIGFEVEKLQLLDELTRGPRNLQIICIHGMPGVGKTTLANELYNHCTVHHYFYERAWCFISQNYQGRRALIDVLTCLRSDLDKSDILEMEDESLGFEIYKSLKGKRYLVVLDDVWNSEVWDSIRRFFPDDANGSRVIFTSRIKDAATFVSKIHTLPLLSPTQCWELLEKKVFHNEPCPPQLLDIGKQIAANCNGLPLVVTVIAGVLANMERRRIAWKKVRESLTFYILSDPSNCIRILDLSYKHLPNHLKMCFLYFGVFPKGTIISARKLMMIWIAEGFIQKQKDVCPEHTAEDYLMDLIDRSLVSIAKVRSSGGVKACMIHDLLHDLCLGKAKEENLLKLNESHFSICEKHQRVSSYTTCLPCSGPFGLHIRSVLGCPTDLSFWSPCMKLLRVLDLSTIIYYESKLESIGLLVQLRYLVLNGIPKSIGNLINLVFLHVNSVLTRNLPSILFQRAKLRYLHAGYRTVMDDCSSYQTNNLRTLSGICFLDSRDEIILRFSPNLIKLKLECAPSHFPDLQFLKELESLTIMCTGYFVALPKINFPLSIRKLTLGRLYMPWEMMSIISRLPNLKVLKLLRDAFHGEKWETRDGEFVELRSLSLRDLDLCNWTSSSDHFPKLEHLSVSNCYNMDGIPNELGDIPTLLSIEVPNHCSPIWTSALQILEEQRENGNEELQIIFTE